MPTLHRSRNFFSTQLHRLMASNRIHQANRALLALWAILACAAVWLIFAAYPTPTGKSIDFTLTPVSHIANQNKPNLNSSFSEFSSPQSPGRYAIQFTAPAPNADNGVIVSIRDKNVRSPNAGLGDFEQVSTGFLWRAYGVSGPQVIYVDTIGVTRFSLTALSTSEGHAVARASYALSALFVGGLAMLTIYACIVAIVAREQLFFHYSAWLFSTLAFGSITAGYDLLWVPRFENAQLEQGIRQLICALWATSTTSLFLGVFEGSIRWPRMKSVLIGMRRVWIAFCTTALFLPSEVFMPAFWGTCLFGLVALTLGVAHVWGQHASKISTWYSVGWLMQLAALGYEMGSILGLLPKQTTSPLIPAGAAAAFFVGVALAEMLRSERQEKQQALDAAESARHQLTDFYDSSPAGLLSYDRSGALVSINKAAKEYLGCAERPPGLKQLVESSTRSALDANERSLTRAAQSPKDAVQHLSLRFRETSDSTEVAIINNTSDFNLQSLLKQQAFTDPLTSLKNRRALYQDLHSAFNARLESTVPPTLLMLDIYSFSDINSYFGQSVGDSVLKEVGKRMRRCGLSGHSYRLAADNFAILVFGSNADATSEADRLQSSMSLTPFAIGRRSINVKTRCAGTALNSFSDADEAVNGLRYLSKLVKQEHGAVKVYVSTDSALQNWQIERRLASLMRSDLWTDQICLFAQPLVSLAGDAEQRFEMLMRVRNGTKLDPPMSFLKAAESIGMMPEIDLYVVELTLKWLETFAKPPLYVTANLSGASLADPNFTTQITLLLAKHASAASHLCLEVTESVAVSDLSRAAQFFTELRRFGVSIALDDFGQGYTNFRSLAALPVQIIKLDGSIVRDVLQSPRHAAILRCLTELTHSLGMRCVAEWVEDKATADELASMQVDIAQGWYFAKAMPLEHWATTPFPVYVPTHEIHI
jgi:diguanylate cyclase (GGDEF)-like protein